MQVIQQTLFTTLLSGCMERSTVSIKPQWWKGNTHTHTFWSDGRDYPEMVAEWYRKNGYNFLTLSDHNILSQGQKWVTINNRHTEGNIHEKYIKRFGADWVETRGTDGKKQVRLKPLNEFRHLLEEAGRFMLIQGEELTPKIGHVNAINTIERIGAMGGKTNTEILQNNINAVLEQEKRTGQQMLPHVNHPNWRWDLSAGDIIPLVGEQFFELYNGGGTSNNNIGNENHVSTERMWDIILAMRLGVLNLPVMYGVGTDDSHIYHKRSPELSPPGRGWIMVRSTHLSPEYIIEAMEAGDFYASNGVTLKDIQFDGKTLKVRIDAEFGVSYTTRFIGTKKGFDSDSEGFTHMDGKKKHTIQTYSDDIGVVFKEVKGSLAEYTFSGDELYVRATVISNKLKHDPHIIGEMEMAWVQPVLYRSDQYEDVSLSGKSAGGTD
jgi:hypothetical protein